MLSNRTVELDQLLLRLVDDAVTDAFSVGMGLLNCRRGCTHCCIGPFPITISDGWRLRRGLAKLDATSALRIRERAQEVIAAVGDQSPDDPKFERLPCPALDLETGACELYQHRPIACRIHGPAIRIDGLDLRHCRLNYVGLEAEELEELRVEIHSRSLEEALDNAFPIGRTYVAQALVADPEPTQESTSPPSPKPEDSSG